MAWSGGTYTRTNGTYSGALVWTSDAAAAVKIRADRHDTHDEDLADGINNCLTKDGQNSPTANISWGGFKITNLANGSAASDSAAYGQTITAFSFDSGTNVLTGTRSAGNLTVDLSALSGGGGAPTNAEYIVGAASGSLSAERVLAGVSGRTAVSFPAGQALVDLAASGVSAGSYSLPTLTVDSYGRITGISSGSAGSGTVTSVSGSGGSTGFDLSGGPITSTGTLTLSVSNAATARAAIGVTRTVSTSAPSGTPADGDVWYVYTP